MTTTNEILKNTPKLPVVDWDLKIYGAHMRQVDNTWLVPEEKHLAFELIYILEGVESIKMKQEVYHVKKGELLLIPPNTPHIMWCDQAATNQYFCVHFDINDPEFTADLLTYCDLYFAENNPATAILIDIMERWIQLFQVAADHTFKTKMEMQIILSALCIQLYEQMEDKKKTYQQQATPSQIHFSKSILEKIKKEFQHCLHNKNLTVGAISIQEIIASCGLSYSYGYALFKKIYGLSPKEYLTRLQLSTAQEYLQIPDLSIEEISHALGYANIAHFSRQFKTWTGLSPLNYRKKNYDSKQFHH